MSRRYVKFYEDWFDVFETMDKECHEDATLMWALANYALYGIEPDLEGCGMLAALFELMKHDAEVGEDE